jgi:glycosyltransferase involved in cell wall biosynthesis
MKKRKIHFCFPLSGPNNGVKIISTYILNNFLEDKSFDLIVIDTAQSRGFDNFGKFNLNKIVYTLILYLKLLKVKREDLIYLNFTPKGFAFFRDFFMILICNIKRGNVTVHVHANDLEKKINPVTRFLLNRIKIIVINRMQYNNLKELHSNLFLVKNALPDFFKLSPLTNKLKDDKIRLLFFSNLSKEKGVFRLESIIRLIGKSNLNCEVNIYGGILDKSNETIFKDLKLNYDFINYFGPITDEKEKYNIFIENNFLLFLSDINYEVSPLVYIEALMSGLPVITTKQVVSDDIINKKCGFHISEEGSELLTLLQDYNFLSSIRKEELKKRCKDVYLKNYSFDYFISQIKTIIIK